MRVLIVCSLLLLAIVTCSGSSENEEDRVEKIETNDCSAQQEISGDRKSADLLPLQWPHRPYGMEEGARLQVDFLGPGLNGSSPNFRSSAELLTDSWGLILQEVARDWLPVTNAKEPEPTTTTKKVGFFNGIQNFFKHSFHAGNTTQSLPSTTTIPMADLRFSRIRLQPLLTPFQSRENPLLRGHDGTFNLRIKAVAISQPPQRGIPMKGLRAPKNGDETKFASVKRRPSFDITKRRFRRAKRHGIY